MRTLEDRSRRNNICVKCIPGSENEGWYVMKEKLRKFFKDELDVENVVIEQVHEVKWNNDNNDNDDQNRKPPTVVANLLQFKDKQDILHEAKSRKIRNFYFKEDFSRETLLIRKGLWN